MTQQGIVTRSKPTASWIVIREFRRQGILCGSPLDLNLLALYTSSSLNSFAVKSAISSHVKSDEEGLLHDHN